MPWLPGNVAGWYVPESILGPAMAARNNHVAVAQLTVQKDCERLTLLPGVYTSHICESVVRGYSGHKGESRDS